jgi:ribonuclease P protein component
MTRKNTLGRQERLKSRKAIEALFQKGNRFTLYPFRVHYSIAESKEIRLGAGVVTRNFKKATDRNRIKRLIKEAWRLQKMEPAAKGLNVFFIYTAKELPSFSIISEKMSAAIQKLTALMHENNTADT